VTAKNAADAEGTSVTVLLQEQKEQGIGPH
jgi:hypothetical protein